MNAFETEPAPPQENEKQADPLFTKGDFLIGMVSYIEALWSRHAEAVRDKNKELRAEVRSELHRAYRELEECQDDINDSSVKPETRETVEFELWMARNHLHKVLH
jgi:ElaB/YqjD/DUF883 family membrane-anchored ribosome-binding protein